MSNVLATGSYKFDFEVPFKLMETGKEGEKPLIVYLHGYKQNIAYFEKKTAPLLSLRAYHLFLQGPYPVYDEEHTRNVERWGRAWYLYDGRQEQFLSSMEKSSQFIEMVVDKIYPTISANRLTLLGYSMGGYLAGYFALSRPKYVDDLVVIGGRIKTESFPNKSYDNLRVLALHGQQDKSVAADPEKESCQKLREKGAAVTYRSLEGGHRLQAGYLKIVRQWLKEQGYVFAKE